MALLFDLMGGAEAQTTKYRHGRAPPLNRVLKQKDCDKAGQDEPTTIALGTQNNASERYRRCIGFDGPLNIPFPVEFL